jgi:hypothetical protein
MKALCGCGVDQRGSDNGCLGTVTGTVSGASPSVATALFLAVACDERTDGGYQRVRQNTICKIENITYWDETCRPCISVSARV